MLSEEEVLKRIGNLTEKLKNYKTAAETSAQEVSTLKKELEKQTFELSETYNESVQLKLRLSDSEKEYSRLKEMTYKTIKHLVEDVIEARDAQIEDIEKDLDAATAVIKEKKELIDTLTEENKNLKEDNENMALVLEKTNNKVNTLNDEKKKIAEEYAEEKGAVTKEREKWSKKLTELSKVNEDNAKVIAQLEADLAAKDQELQAVKAASAEIKQKKEELVKKVNQLQQENSGEHFTTYPYRLGRTSEKVKNRFVEFVTKMYEDALPDSETGTYPLKDMAKVAKEMGLNEADEKTITSVLLNITYKDGEKLLDADHNSKLSKEEFINWITFIKEN